MTPPAVAERDATDDRNWFAENPQRRYRLRVADGTGWLIRRRAGRVLLRARITSAMPRCLPDTDKALRPIWFSTALPHLDPIERGELVRAARQGERR